MSQSSPKTDRPRLIEVLMPMEQASIRSPHEKYISSGGYIATFHVWPARRPLAACRAALLATLLPDPGDPDKRAALLKMIGGEIVTTTVEKEDAAGNLVFEEKQIVKGGLLAWNAEDEKDIKSLRAQIRKAAGGQVPKVFDPFSGGGAIPLESLWLGAEVTASDLNPVAWLLLRGTLEYPRQFAGQKWPMPVFVEEWSDFMEDFLGGAKKTRRGWKAHFTDPVQGALANMMEGDLRWHIKAWGRWVLERAQADLARYYPVINHEPTVAYLWARTVRDIQTEGRIPILKTFMLSRTVGKRTALLPVPDDANKVVRFKLLTEKELATEEKRKAVVEEHPFLQGWGITGDNLLDFLKKGTKSDAGVWSPFKGGRPALLALTMDEIRQQGRQGLMSIQMTAVCVQGHIPGKKQTVKKYRLPTDAEIQLGMTDTDEIDLIFTDIPGGLPDEQTPKGGGKKASRAFSVHQYGLTKWRDLFTPRQLLAIGVFIKHTRSAFEFMRQEDLEHAEALSVYLTVILGKLIDSMSTSCRWRSDHQKLVGTIAGYKLPMVWDFGEANPLIDSDLFYIAGTRAVSEAVREFCRACAPAEKNPSILCMSSLNIDLDQQDLCFTDPPYYDAIPYADLMNFFRIWQKRIIGDYNDTFREIFARPSPTWSEDAKDGELIDDDSRHGGDAEKSRKAYEDGMARAFDKSLASLKPDGRMVVVFANKEVDAWQSLIAALIRAGALVTASWPIQTEMVNKVTQKRANLSTSVWIVCRKRDPQAAPGWDEQVLNDMRRILLDPRDELGGKNILRYFFDSGVRGADFLWAALGPALAAYSEHPFVKNTGGGVMSVRDFLNEVRKLVLHFALGALKGFDDVQDNRSGEASFELDPVTQYYLLHREAFGFEPVLAGICIQYANAVGKTDRELQMVWNVIEQGGKKKAKRKKTDEDEGEDSGDEDGEMLNSNAKADKYQLVTWEARIKDTRLGENRETQASPLIDKLHRLMLLLKQNRADEVQAQYEAWGLAGDTAFPRLLQAVRELSLEDQQPEERRLVEALASQLKMNRRVMTQDHLVKETSLFDYGASQDEDKP